MNKILECEGRKMFYGIMSIVLKTNAVKPFDIEGTRLYKPEYNCWYCKGSSYTANICIIKEVKQAFS